MNFADTFEALSDNITAMVIVFAGIYLALFKDFNQGYTLIGVGFGYLAGKAMPRQKRVVLGS